MKNVLFLILFLSIAAVGQTETLSNADVISMTKNGLGSELIARKIKDSNPKFETTTQDLIDLKKAGVADEIIVLMLDAKAEKSVAQPISQTAQTARLVPDSREVLRAAKTFAIVKSTINPSRQALEKELLKRREWQQLNLNIVREKENADLYVDIGFVPLSIITHRYVFSVYDSKTGTVIAAGETTSWGSLAENLARHISKKLAAILPNGK